jgi:DNA-binding NarL/FixJ family response regulator
MRWAQCASGMRASKSKQIIHFKMLPKILLIEDDMLLVSYMLPTMQNNYAVTPVHTVEQARAELAANSFDIVLLDLNLGDNICGADLLPEINETGAKVIVVSATCSGDLALRCLRNKIRAFVDKLDCADGLIPTIERVLRGEQVFPENWLARLGAVATPDMPLLNYVELRVLDMLMIDPTRSNADIADTLNRSESTVKHILSDLFVKFDLTGRLNLVYEANRRSHIPNLTQRPLPDPAGGPRRRKGVL